MAYAVTIHKCQGLSLDCAIVDLSDNVFCAGMAYVAMSRVRTLEGFHLTAFDPKSIIVNNSCLEEVKTDCILHLGKTFHCMNFQRKRSDRYNVICWMKRLLHTNVKQNQRLRDNVVVIFQSLPPQPKSGKLQITIKTEVVVVHRLAAPRYDWSDYRHYPVDEAWQ